MTELENLSFEQALERLENIVAQLENGDVPLEQAIELYQEGMKLSSLCNGKLQQVESKIEMLIQTEQGLATKPFAASQLDKGE
ncbi:exodeoxyribonuclease VII small subunit [Paenibacillus camelliae]|uniref:exodeoxyribonuclease VII small subunit n=1 Tax=Paenibacillus camelliae TaxID=512410 RepID=UPI00203DCA3B|nr:exodeoxyribonuclease VII small subunit [Paenibacillus camelliae]MCM3633163.1 exodeoxyribonuclease VII small subunit [Paenibacillus camelliae]